MRTAICVVVLALACGRSYAEAIRVTRGACGDPVRLVARDAPLSHVLKRLGESLGFAVTYQSSRDPTITRDVRAAPVELVLALAQGTNFSLEQIADRRCENASRVAKLVVLGEQSDKIPTAATQNFQTPEIERIARQGLSDYLKSHGMDDQTIESIAVR